MKFLNQLKNRFSIMSELMIFLWARRLWWMMPTVIVTSPADALKTFYNSGLDFLVLGNCIVEKDP